MCQTNDDPNALAILLVVRATRTDVNARAAGTRQKNGGQERCKKKRGPPNVRPVLRH